MRKFRTLTHVYMQHGGLLGNGVWTDEKADSLEDLVQYRKALMSQLVLNDPTRITGSIVVDQNWIGVSYRIIMGEWPAIRYTVQYESHDMGRVVFSAWTVRDDAPPSFTALLN